ncbi:Hypothetical predicted protein [Octopus vulgaris]|uniref:Uncharacterized protein n=1 Tax=Octopus vulgaris TaxID=6645 RepID=A0AA36F8E2_OCTVU|nr:Hypothetical predicted protein [Octopus vulgaris]
MNVTLEQSTGNKPYNSRNGGEGTGGGGDGTGSYDKNYEANEEAGVERHDTGDDGIVVGPYQVHTSKKGVTGSNSLKWIIKISLMGSNAHTCG